jgi:hypothetical protein
MFRFFRGNYVDGFKVSMVSLHRGDAGPQYQRILSVLVLHFRRLYGRRYRFHTGRHGVFPNARGGLHLREKLADSRVIKLGDGGGDVAMTTDYELKMKVLAHKIDHYLTELHGKRVGFFLNVGEFGDTSGRAHYISNCQRDTAIMWMKETIERFEEKET